MQSHTRAPAEDQDKFLLKSSDNCKAGKGPDIQRAGEEAAVANTAEDGRTSLKPSRASVAFVASEELEAVVRLCKHELAAGPEEKVKRSGPAYPGVYREGWQDYRDRVEPAGAAVVESVKRRQTAIRTNGGEQAVRAGERRTVSPPRRSLRSLTPEEDAEDSTSFHETFEKELVRRRRTRRRSASCSSRCCDSHGHSTHSATGASSRNSSSRSEKSSTRSERSSRSPSLEHIKQGAHIRYDPLLAIFPVQHSISPIAGCNSSQCRARTSLR